MQKKAPFITGSIWRHVITMTLTNSIGLMALFLVDLIDLYFLNLLGETEMAAAVGFSAQLMFYITSISIGFLITISVLVSRRIGAKEIQQAKQIATSTLIIASVVTLFINSFFLWQLVPLLKWLGAEGRTLELSITYSQILLPSSCVIVIGMLASGILRAMGDAKRSMNTTLIAAITNFCLDPLFIFTFDMGIAGAAWATFISRVLMLFYAMYCVISIYKMLVIPRWKYIKADIFPITKLAIPIVLTNLATPIGSTFVMTEIARFGAMAVAAYATIGRIIPVAFSVLFSLSSAISPIIGQNFGAKNYARVKETYKNAIIFTICTVIIVSLIIFISKAHLVNIFNLSGTSAELMLLFCSGLTLFYIADGILFSTNAVFNTLGYPVFSTLFNYAKYFLGVIPTVYLLSYFYGAKGVIIGQSIGTILVSFVAVIICNRLIKKVSHT